MQSGQEEAGNPKVRGDEGQRRDTGHTPSVLFPPWSQINSFPRAISSFRVCACSCNQHAFSSLLSGEALAIPGPHVSCFSTCHVPEYSWVLPFKNLPPFCLHTDVTYQPASFLYSLHVMSFLITKHLIPLSSAPEKQKRSEGVEISLFHLPDTKWVKKHGWQK